MKLLTALILENEGFSLNDLSMIQRMALKRIYSGRFNPERVSDKETVVLDSLVDLGLLDIGYDLTPDGEHAAKLLDLYGKRDREDLSVAKQLAAADAKNFNVDEDDYNDEDEFPFTEHEHAIMKSAGLNPKTVAKLFLKENMLSALTHYVVTPEENGMVRAFKLGKCPHCQGEVQLDEPIKVDMEGAKKLKLKRIDYYPAKEVDGEYGSNYCENCRGEPIEDEEDEENYNDYEGYQSHDLSDDGDALASAGMGTDEDYGDFSGGDDW